MSAFNFAASPGAAINFRGLTGTLIVVSQRSGASVSVQLDSSGHEGNRFLMQCPAGNLLDDFELRPAYAQAQFFFTPALSAGNWSISTKGVFDAEGKSVSNSSGHGKQTIGFELRVDENASGDVIWIGWLADKLGKRKVDLVGDGKSIAKLVVDVQKRDEASIQKDLRDGTLRINSHIAPKLAAVKVGDLVTIPLKLVNVQGLKLIELKVS